MGTENTSRKFLIHGSSFNVSKLSLIHICGGTLQGIAKYLLEQNPDTKIVAVEPKGVSALHGDGPGIHQIQGIGDGFIPDVLDLSLIHI